MGVLFGGIAREACPDCSGRGEKDGTKCPKCDGKGWQTAVDKPRKACGYCMGSGKTLGGGCKHCGGSGYMELDANGQPIDLALGAKAREQKCSYCLGFGFRPGGYKCDSCGGTGKKI
jgi:DnaJ-class molecular chaperone